MKVFVSIIAVAIIACQAFAQNPLGSKGEPLQDIMERIELGKYYELGRAFAENQGFPKFSQELNQQENFKTFSKEVDEIIKAILITPYEKDPKGFEKIKSLLEYAFKRDGLFFIDIIFSKTKKGYLAKYSAWNVRQVEQTYEGRRTSGYTDRFGRRIITKEDPPKIAQYWNPIADITIEFTLKGNKLEVLTYKRD
ncbi:MAG: hypothetical protein WCV73_02955 [Patescibacteria group bacterium]|jgi:hypothetical protein